MRLLFILFIVLPLIEIYVLIKVGSFIGPLTTIAIILITAVIGYQLFRAQGTEKLEKMRATMSGAKSAEGESLAMDIAEGAAILVAGILLLTPGFVTDAFGFLCLFPPTRKAMIKKLVERSIIHVNTNGQFHAHAQSNGATADRSNSMQGQNNVIEGEYTDNSNDPNQK